MADKKNLPIRVFQKREIDTRETEGGGGKDPSWVLEGSELREHSSSLANEFYQIHKIIEKQSLDREIPTPISVDIREKAIAKSHRDAIEKIFLDEKNNYSSIGFTPNNELLFLVKNDVHSKKIDKNLKSVVKNKKGISAIKKISKFKPYIEKDIDFKDAIKIKLIDYKDESYKEFVHHSFRNFCSNKGIELKRYIYTKNLDVYRAVKVTEDSFNLIQSFDGIFSIESMPKYGFTFDQLIYAKEVEIKKPTKGKTYPRVGILDSGIEKIKPITPWIYGKKSPYIKDELDTRHGTFVAGIVVYGDELIDRKVVDSEGCFIFDAPVISDISLGHVEEGELIDNIREVISERKDEIKVWSLSLGTHKEASLNYFSDFGIALDEIQELNRVIICKSAGNCRNFEKSKPPSRIAISADSVRSIVVGSIAHEKCETDLADINCHSPFSRVGPGPQHIIKPDLVHYGGNIGLSASGITLPNGVHSFGNDGKLTSNCGTSYSTPRVSALAAELNHNLDGKFDPIFLKTLILHSAKYPSEIVETHLSLLKKYGFGLPPSTGNILFNDDYEITMILKDELPKGQFIEILDFPYPDELENPKGYYYGEITVTLVSDCLLDRTQGKEYCQSDLDVALGTYDTTTKRDTTKPIIKNPLGRKNSKNLLSLELYSKKTKKRRNGIFNREPLLIQNGKFHPVKKFVCNLDDVTKANRDSYLKAPKKWYLKVTGFYRQNIERIAEDTGMDLKNRFCLAITVRDPMRTRNVYNNVAQLLTTRNFQHNQLEIRQDFRIRVTQES